MKYPETEKFISFLSENSKLYWPTIKKNIDNNSEEFFDLAEKMLLWSKRILGDDNFELLLNGFKSFVTDVNKSQMRYERDRKYRFSSYEEVFSQVYGNAEYMKNYHWGVYLSTFLWEHHLLIYKFFKDEFIDKYIKDEGNIIEFGSGSGIWGILALNDNPGCRLTGIDISAHSVETANKMAGKNGFGDITNYIEADALKYKSNQLHDIGISCFLLEHLETPEQLFANIEANLKEGAMAFVTGALTASEHDHIFEFKRESEINLLAEANGFRVVKTFSSAPVGYSRDYHFLPRSMALVLQKRKNEIW
jgi:2-polyprenyl-3-methyl-5-hydroxy-6-metoxy-1,4-benzoquinol methylase